MIRDLQDDARVLLRQLSGDDPEEFLHQAQQMRERLDCLTAGLVGRARLRRVTWSRIGQALTISEDTARHRYTDDYVLRRLRQVSRLRAIPKSLSALYSEPSRHYDAAVPDDGAVPAAAEATGPAYNSLAPVLSMLARASEIPLQDLAHRVECSPSYLSRILSGQRVPSWPITERLAQTCGADPAIVRKLWETEQLRRRPPRSRVDDSRGIDSLAGVSDRAQAIRKLVTALRTLHVRAGQPTPQEICIRSRWRLQAHQVTAILERNEPCDWPTLVLLLGILGGSTDYFRPLWQAATEHPHT
ncbi:helix-turn-helix transcriptional regulator [Streptomyces sp. HNM0663]|uniref:Helix-turn-helix transcriptional regulator n=1 Tax=Streptomyces chengmaiensis TaxID=3040919 RepID=A0ABT6I0E8_9ACTN|nr:helix-turn-helix transcriptional regulator [Streptomyces chengmaiensis]MDH2393634.1 helix-turn-helix transcriptional regulator [Streptomyces chengmaiensis]